MPNKPVGEGAEVINGEIVMWMDGRRRSVRPYLAWSEWLWLHDSPVAETRERAKTKAQAGETGQYARRQKRGHGSIQSRGFDKTRTKRFDGSVVARQSQESR